ncbi:hypothetical protein [Actinoplanes sp. NPDC049599]|uniref:hypothetical protein n=1 Tax=Actinoplanes sp. NPDC049599 TaxID=3363903 RepID=UPI00378C1349
MIGTVSRGIVAGALLASAGVLGVAGPAAAAESCGAHKNARVSIYYWACATGSAQDAMDVTYHFQNNHGSRVSITYQVGPSIAGGSVDWGSARTVPINTGNASYENWAFGCTKGKGVRAAIRVKENNGSWGAIAYSGSITCK